jgi:hypothetical protein
MTDTRTPRPTDLVALVAFGEDVRENMAVTRDHLGVPQGSARPLAAAIEQWLHLGRRTWINVSGREIQGIATARDLAAKSAWEIDTLVDAPDASEEVTVGLLRQAGRAARDAEVTHVLLRTHVDSPAAEAAPRAGFRRVVDERLWIGHLAPGASSHVRDIRPADAQSRFQVFCRALPATVREALAMTLEEWQAVQDARWMDRGGFMLVDEYEGRLRASLEASSLGQFRLLVESGTPEAGEGILAVAGQRLPGVADHFALVAEGTAAEDAVRRAGMEPAGEYALFCLRLARPVREESRARAGVVVTGG